jgi:hypothetical protein
MTAGHFIFIPSVLLIGVVIGWVLGSRAARDAYGAELRRREEKAPGKQKRSAKFADSARRFPNSAPGPRQWTSGKPA